MFYFNLLVKNKNFYVYFWLFLLKKACQGLYKKMANRQKNFGGMGG